MWKIFETKSVIKQLKRSPEEIIRKYLFWKSIIMADGPSGVKRISGFKDHALKGEWQGARSSRLNDQWRVIYFCEDKKLEVIILEVTPHDYRKKS